MFSFDLLDQSTWLTASNSSNIQEQHHQQQQQGKTNDIPPSIRYSIPTLSFTTPIMPHPSITNTNIFNGLHSTHLTSRLGQEMYEGNLFDHLTSLLNWVNDLGGYVSPIITLGIPPSLAECDVIGKSPLINLLLDENGTPNTSNLGIFAKQDIQPNTPLIKVTSNHIIFPTGLCPMIDNPSPLQPKHLGANKSQHCEGIESISSTTSTTSTTSTLNHQTNNPNFQKLINSLSLIAPPELSHIHIAIRLFLERCLGCSFYSPALAVLPKEYPTIDFLNPNTIYLDPENSPQQLISHIQFIQRHFYTMIDQIFTLKLHPHSNGAKCTCTTLFEQLLDYFPLISSQSTLTTSPHYQRVQLNQERDLQKQWIIDQLIWSYYTAVSRCFGSPPSPHSTLPSAETSQTCFIPLIDLLNNDTETPNCFITFTALSPSSSATTGKTKNRSQKVIKPLHSKPTTSSSTSSSPQPTFLVTLTSGPKGLQAGQELTFSYTTQDHFNQISLPVITGQYDEVAVQLREVTDIEDLFTISLLRTPHQYINRWLYGGKDISNYFIFYGMGQKLHYEESIFIHNLNLSILSELVPHYSCLAQNYQSTQGSGGSTQFSIQDAPIPFILPFPTTTTAEPSSSHPTYFNLRHDAIIQKILNYPGLSKVMTWDWTGPSSPLYALCRCLALGGFDPLAFRSNHLIKYSQSPLTLGEEESSAIIKGQMSRCCDAMCDLIEKRICDAYIPTNIITNHITNGLLINPLCDISIDMDVKLPNMRRSTKIKGMSKKGTPQQLLKPLDLAPFDPEHYILAFSDPIDDYNEYGAMTIAYALMINQAKEMIEKDGTKGNERTLRRILNDLYTALLERNFFAATTKYYEYSKVSLISHSLVVLATRFQLDKISPSSRPSFFIEHFLAFHHPQDQVPNTHQLKQDRSTIEPVKNAHDASDKGDPAPE